ncbi:metallophosphoesterase [Limoniibacter endophyticus]|uniref:Calcineurin-like phosphoesterase domain-containing protein n=1 Tax=Limoniibacter endophyticus TaxID=1565040 RepID=A0A8J3DN58_9HYPH|nr:metallophosphoesterase [Limoniibacter endophyticus]GHC69573.1 hypothetical protein GCM10010136_15550 [Limoniibacter endophyticus]
MLSFRSVLAALLATSLSLPAMAQDPASNPATPASNNSASTGVTQRFVIRSDTQYPWTNKGGDGSDSEDEQAESRELIEAQDAAINVWRDSKGSRDDIPIFLNGDVTAFYHGWQADYMKSRIAAMAPTYYGLGNHDYENNVDDCYQNGCASQAMQDLFRHIDNIGADARDNYQESGFGWEKYRGSQAYSKTIGDFTFIQLHNHFNYVKQWDDPFTNFERKEYRIEPSLNWLEEQLKNARSAGKLVIINMHRPPADLDGLKTRFSDLMSEYEVVAIFHGHTHIAGVGSDIGGAKVLNTGAAFNKTFMTAEFKKAEGVIEVFQATDNVVSPSPVAEIPIRKDASNSLAVPNFGNILPSRNSVTFTVHASWQQQGQPKPKGITAKITGMDQEYGTFFTDNYDEITIPNLTPSTDYTVTIQSEDDFGRRSKPVTRVIRTADSDTGPAKPINFCFNTNDKIVEWSFEHYYENPLSVDQEMDTVLTVNGSQRIPVGRYISQNTRHEYLSFVESIFPFTGTRSLVLRQKYQSIWSDYTELPLNDFYDADGNYAPDTDEAYWSEYNCDVMNGRRSARNDAPRNRSDAQPTNRSDAETYASNVRERFRAVEAEIQSLRQIVRACSSNGHKRIAGEDPPVDPGGSFFNFYFFSKSNAVPFMQ